MSINVTFWGVRGSIPTPRFANLGVGGNTSCVEVRSDDHILIIDAGTGIQNCGKNLLSQNENPSRDVWIFFSHFHWDHLQGLPFFEPLYLRDFRLHLVSSGPAELTRARLQRLMQSPYFPVEWEDTPAQKNYYSLPIGGLDLGGIKVEPVPLNHPQGATGYRIGGPFGFILYASDFEHGNPAGDLCVLQSARDAKLLVYDAQFTPQEYEGAGRRGWGHSTWFEGARIAKEAQVQRLMLFHHDPGHTDLMMAEIQDEARQLFANTDIAMEGNSVLIE